MDVLHHLNNASLMRYYEEARIRFMHDLADRLGGGFRGLVAAVNVDYLHVAEHPDPLLGAVAVGAMGRSSLRLLQAMFQADRCVGVADVTLVRMAHGRQHVEALPDAWRSTLDSYRLKTSR